MNNEEIKNEFINCIEGTHTLNLAISVLEDREEYKKEIERLTENNQAYQEELCRVWEERDNAYRIINELEKWLIIQHDVYVSIDKEENTRLSCQFLKVKDKLQELKENK